MQTPGDPQQWYASTPNEVHVTRIDVPFVDLTWFFVKASVALAVALSVTSWLWVLLGTGIITLSTGLLLLIGVPDWLAPPPAPAPAPVALPTPPPPTVAAPTPVPALVEDERVDEAAAPEPQPEPAVDPNRAATEAAQRAELERIRRERGR